MRISGVIESGGKRGGKESEGLQREWAEMALVDDLIEWSYVVIATSGSSVGIEPDRPPEDGY